MSRARPLTGRGLSSCLLAMLALLPAPAGALGFGGHAGRESVYVTNFGADSISALMVLPDGSLRRTHCQRGALDCATGRLPVGITAVPDGRYVYVTNEGSDSISPFAVTRHGALRPLPCPGDSCSTGPGSAPVEAVVDPSGSFLYVLATNEGAAGGDIPGHIVSFRIAPDGTLSPGACTAGLPGRPNCLAGSQSGDLAIDPTGRFLYVTDTRIHNGPRPGDVTVFRVEPAGGLTRLACDPQGPCQTGLLPDAPAIDPSGRFLYLVAGFLPQVSPAHVESFQVAADGTLTAGPCSQAANCPMRGEEPTDLALHPSGRWLYTVARSSDISAFGVRDGALTPLPCSDGGCAAGQTPTALAIEPQGRFLYVANSGSNDISAFAITRDGRLRQIDCRPRACATGAAPQRIAIVQSHRHHRF